METTERVVEAYCRYVKGWATIPNIRCGGQQEIDLLAYDLRRRKRYHIEVSVSISAFSKLTDNEFSLRLKRDRVKGPAATRTLGYFVEWKFGSDNVKRALEEYGFTDTNHRKVIVSWDWTEQAAARAKAERIILWRFGDLLNEIAEKHAKLSHYFADDTLRTLQLFEKARGIPASG